MPEQPQIGDTVRVHYTGRFENGQVFDSSTGGDPLEFKVGGGGVIAGFDEGVRTMHIGDDKTVEIEPANAYGLRMEQLVQTISRTGINLDTEPEVGMQLAMQLPDGNEIPVLITHVTHDSLTLDANHPIAGHKLIFDIKLVEIVPSDK
jgi:peptidylprolyl isomerase